MKKLIGIGIAAMMVMGLAGAASAADQLWIVNMSATTQATSGYSTTSEFSSSATATSGIDAADKTASGIAGATWVVWLGSTNGGSAAGLLKDVRKYAGETMTWDLQLFVRNGSPLPSPVPTAAYIHAWNPADVLSPVRIDKAFTATGTETLKLYQVVGNERSLLWTLNGNGNGLTDVSGKTYHSASAFDIASSRFQLEVGPTAVVPEPGSMVAMFSGLVGLVGFGIRRKK